MKPLPQTMLISFAVVLVLALVSGGIIATTNPPVGVQRVIGLAWLVLGVALGVVWHRRVRPVSAVGERLFAALTVPVIFVALNVWVNLGAGASHGLALTNLVLAVVALAVGFAVGSFVPVRARAAAEPVGYR